MPGLVQALLGHDLGHLRVVADAWGIELKAWDARSATDQIVAALPNLTEHFDELPADVQTTLDEISAEGGRMLWFQFVRRYGEMRVIGPGRRDRDKPHLNPNSTAEKLWYRSLIARSFFDGEEGLQEYAYIPDEFLNALPSRQNPPPVYGRPARPDERMFFQPADEYLIDDATTLLVALRMGKDLANIPGLELPAPIVKAFLNAAGLLDAQGQPATASVRKFLELKRPTALQQLMTSWMPSITFDELRLMPGLIAEGAWENSPALTRAKILKLLKNLPRAQWWSLASFIADVKKSAPDFQRPGGDYDSWYLRDAASGEYLRGFENWDRVDGALLAFMISGPFHWLGLVDLATATEEGEPTAFKLSRWSMDMLQGREPQGILEERRNLELDSHGSLSVLRSAPRPLRYQLARFCEWLPMKAGRYEYQLTAASLNAARSKGLKASQFLKLVVAPIPPNLKQALTRWEQQGPQGRLTNLLVLRLQSAAALKALRASRAARYLAEPIGPLAVAIKPGSAKQVLQILLELGYFGELEE